MTMDDVIRMARKVWGEQAILPFEQLERFAELVAARYKDDADRLDWLNLAGNRYAFDIAGTWYSRKDHRSPFTKHKTIRAAIDAARAKEQTP